MARKLALLISYILFLLANLSGQSAAWDVEGQPVASSAKKIIGKPLIKTYSPGEYGSAPQCKGINQAPEGLIYMSNNSTTLLEFDGVSWRKIALPSNIHAVTLGLTGEGEVYVGGANEIGYLVPDSVGQMQYVSLLHQLDAEDQQELFITDIIAGLSQVFFLTSKKIFRWNGEQMQTWETTTRFVRAQVINEVFYGYQSEIGLFSIQGDSLALFPPEIRLADRLYCSGIK